MKEQVLNTTGGKKTWLKDYPTYGELLSDANQELPSERDSRSEGDSKWYGTKDFPSAMKLAQFGWREGTEKINKLAKDIEDLIGDRIKRPAARWDVSGSNVDIGKFLHGEPECMIDYTDLEESQGIGGRYLEVILNMTASCSIPKDLIEARGSAVLALVNLLSCNGYSVKLTLCSDAKPSYGGSGGNCQIALKCTIKEYDQVIDTDRLAFVFAHASSFRRIIFGAWETYSKQARDSIGVHPGHGYGRAINSDYVGESSAGCQSLVLNSMSHSDFGMFDTEAKCTAWVKDQLKAQGVKFIEEV